jgi:hypothetical protein
MFPHTFDHLLKCKKFQGAGDLKLEIVRICISALEYISEKSCHCVNPVVLDFIGSKYLYVRTRVLAIRIGSAVQLAWFSVQTSMEAH